MGAINARAHACRVNEAQLPNVSAGPMIRATRRFHSLIIDPRWTKDNHDNSPHYWYSSPVAQRQGLRAS